jgi:polyhydroxybutyrate depolymerase
MNRPHKLLFALSLGLIVAARVGADPVRWELSVEGQVREALIDAPASAKDKDSPLVFAFHGHGGSAVNGSRMFDIRRNWPEAVAVYPQGFPTPGRLTDPEGKRSGWQHGLGDQGDRDLKFFDALLERLRKEYKIDAQRVHVTGHSNGGGFTYLLWVTRGDTFASLAPSAAVGPRGGAGLKPKPVMHLAGRKDELVKFSWQEKTIKGLRQLNHCDETGEPWAEHATRYSSKDGPPFVAYVHPGAHGFPREAPALIVRFFKENPRLEPGG